MIGPTGVGKTEIARRLATLTQAPFVKVEATKLYRGRLPRPRRRIDDPRSGRDRRRNGARRNTRPRNGQGARKRRRTDPRYSLPGTAGKYPSPRDGYTCGEVQVADTDAHHETREKLRKLLRDGYLNEREVEIEVTQVRRRSKCSPRKGWKRWA